MAEGDIGAVIGSLEFDGDDGDVPSIIHVAGDVYAIAYKGVAGDGWLKTVTISTNGLTLALTGSSLEFDADACTRPKIIHIHGHIFAIVYKGNADAGRIVTVTIADNGTITDPVTGARTFKAGAGHCDIIHISGNVYAIAFYDTGTIHGKIYTWGISEEGVIAAALTDELEFDTVYGVRPAICHVAGAVYAIAYTENGSEGKMVTVSITAAGVIGDSVLDTEEFDNSSNWESSIIRVAADMVAVAYRGPDSDGWLKTAQIDSGGLITAGVIGEREFEAGTAINPVIIHVSNDVYVIAYSDGVGDGWLKTYSITAAGAISALKIDELEFDGSDGTVPSTIHVDGDVYAIAYKGVAGDGWLKTVGIATVQAGKIHHELMMGIG